MTSSRKKASPARSLRVNVVEAGESTSKASLACVIGKNLCFSTESLESYFFAKWDPVVYDALVVAAAVEYCDRAQKRSAFAWGREFELSIPVHDPDRWNDTDTARALHDALDFLTGDRWRVTFRARKQPVTAVRQGQFPLNGEVAAVIPFSDGLDSRSVAGLMQRSLGNKLVRIHLGHTLSQRRERFTAVPYRVVRGARALVESSARSRGFKFALIAGIASYFSGAAQIIVPESGQGALGPALLAVGQGYPDYRSHPLFTNRMERFLEALFGHRASFQFPQLWNTKGETLSRFLKECGPGATWAETWSCWQQARQASVDGKKRQCGICAACMLRRLSVHAAGLSEPNTTYVWQHLAAAAFESGAASGFDQKRITRAMKEYAIAGTLHLDHLAALTHSSTEANVLSLNVSQLSQALRLDNIDVRERLHRLLNQHEIEWKSFVRSHGPKSFVAGWAPQGR